jgi:hypothetical protein
MPSALAIQPYAGALRGLLGAMKDAGVRGGRVAVAATYPQR